MVLRRFHLSLDARQNTSREIFVFVKVFLKNVLMFSKKLLNDFSMVDKPFYTHLPQFSLSKFR